MTHPTSLANVGTFAFSGSFGENVPLHISWVEAPIFISDFAIDGQLFVAVLPSSSMRALETIFSNLTVARELFLSASYPYNVFGAHELLTLGRYASASVFFPGVRTLVPISIH